MPNRVIEEKLTKRGETDDFDREFWRKAGHEACWAAAAEMVVEVELFRGKHARELRLQRTVETLRRRKG